MDPKAADGRLFYSGSIRGISCWLVGAVGAIAVFRFVKSGPSRAISCAARRPATVVR